MFKFLDRWRGSELARLRAEVEHLKSVTAERIFSGGASSGYSETQFLAYAREEEKHLFGWTYTIVRCIAQRIAAQPICVARRTRTPRPHKRLDRKRAPLWVKQIPDGLQVVDDHPILDAVRNPNPYMPGLSLLWNTVASLETTGKAFWWIYLGESGKQEIYPLPASWVEPVHDQGLFAQYRIWPRYVPNPAPFMVSGQEIVRFYLPDPQNPVRWALAPLATQAKAVNTDEAIQEAQHKSFQNGIHPGLAIIIGKGAMSDGGGGLESLRPTLTKEQRGSILAALKQAHRGAFTKGEPIILDGLIEDIKKITNSVQEMDYLESGGSVKARLFQAFGVNPILVGEIENANRAQAAVADDLFVYNTVNPKIEMLSQWMTMELPERFDDPDVVVFMEEARPRDPEQNRAEYDQLAKYGSITRDELRAAYSLPPLLQGGDELIPMAAAKPAPGEEGGAGQARATFRVRIKGAAATKVLWLRTHGAGEKTFASALKVVFDDMAKSVAHELRQSPGAGTDALLVSDWLPKVKAVCREQMGRLAVRGVMDELRQNGKAFRARHKAADDFDKLRMKIPPRERAAVDAFLDRTFQEDYWEDLLEPVKLDLAKTLKESMDIGESGEQRADRVQAVLEGASHDRGLRIARTETGASLNAGHQAAREHLDSMGLLTGKQWLSVLDKDTRDSHVEANEQIVGVMEPFVVGDEECQYPGDNALSAEERVFCRCTSISVLKDLDEVAPDGEGEGGEVALERGQISYPGKALTLLLRGRGDHLKWDPPDFGTSKNKDEIERAAEGLAKLDVDVTASELKKVLKAGAMKDLDGATWKRIVNTDSLKVEKLADVLEIVHAKKKKLRGVLEEFILDKVRAPIVVEMPDGDYFLVNGNTRLMVARIFGVKPQVWCAEIKE